MSSLSVADRPQESGAPNAAYDPLGEQIGYETKRQDASRPWVVLGTAVAMVAAGAALLIGQRLP